MDTTATAQAQQKFSNLRRRLDQLGYKQPLGVESFPLVEKMFADLIHTTESLKKAKHQLGQKQADSLDAESIMAPYRSDNARLIKENNEIHMKLIKLKEDSDMAIRGNNNNINIQSNNNYQNNNKYIYSNGISNINNNYNIFFSNVNINNNNKKKNINSNYIF